MNGRKCLLLMMIVFCAANIAKSNEKVGHCGRHVKRNICQCPPQGTDNCNDQCTNDNDCPGLRKCCSDGCKRACKLPLLSSAPQQKCPQGEEYNICGPCRPASCTQPIANRTECVSGCNCPPGYVRSSDGRCIKPKDCPALPPPALPVCAGRHEFYDTCYRRCQGSCANPKAEGCTVTGCSVGCFCAPGYVRSGTGRCISPSSCPQLPSSKLLAPPPPAPSCQFDQEYSSCRRECEATCANPTTNGCFRQCQAGCFCKSPLVRDPWGKCVSVDACPKLITQQPFCSSDLETFLLCQNKCQATCDEPTGQCNSRCVTGCFCREGYVRHKGACITVDQCPPPIMKLPPTPSTPICENELQEYNSCYRGCERTCTNPTGTGCSNNQCVGGCFCQSPLVRNHLGQCVDESECQMGCGFHEHFEECGPTNPDTCPPQRSGSQSFSDGCQTGCFCDQGYARNITDGNCIQSTQCPTNTGARVGCGFGEESVTCGDLCAQGCDGGFSSHSCPSTCRRRCCRRRLRL